MADFNIFYSILAINEGGYQNNPSDFGNYNSLKQCVGTNLGISAPVYESFIKRPPTIEDMKAITKEIAIKITKHNYWDIIQGDYINNQSLCDIFADFVFNSGTGIIRNIQLIIKVTPDNVFGSQSLTAFNNYYTQEDLFNLIKQNRIN